MNENTAPETKEEIPETPTIIDDVPAEDPRDALIRQMEHKFAKSPEQQALEEQVKRLQEDLEQAGINRATLERKLEQSHKRESDLGKTLSRERKEHEREVRQYERELQEATAGQVQSIKWPCICIAIFAVLSLLVGLCVDKGWMVALIGEPLGYGCICVCAFFGGITWKVLRK